MTAPNPYATTPQPAPQPPQQESSSSPLMRIAIWFAIGALIIGAIVCVVMVLVGTQGDLIGRTIFTILLLVAFAGATILDSHLAPRRPTWLVLASMGTWIIALLLGAMMIWMPERSFFFTPFYRVWNLLLIVGIMQLVLLHARLYLKALRRYDTVFTRSVAIVTMVLVVGLAVMLIIPLAFGEWLYFADIYWRLTVALAILAAVGTALVPLVNLLFAPKQPRPAAYYPAPAAPGYPGAAPVPALGPATAPGAVAPAPALAPSVPHAAPVAPGAAVAPAAPAPEHPAPAAQELLPWPTYVDGVTPLPMLPDGSPDWNAYYTGYPSPGAQVFLPIEHAAGAAAAPASQPATEQYAAPHADGNVNEQPLAPQQPAVAPGYEGYPPPPPMPPRP